MQEVALLVLFMELAVLAVRALEQQPLVLEAVDLAPVGLEAMRKADLRRMAAAVELVSPGLVLRRATPAAAAAGLWGPGGDPLPILPLGGLDTLRDRLFTVQWPITVQRYMEA
jgi:hypothetical protein